MPHDNNIGQRNVVPVAFKNFKDWIKAVSTLHFTLKNPNRRASKMQLVATLPRVLVKRGWKLEFVSAAGSDQGRLPQARRRREHGCLAAARAG